MMRSNYFSERRPYPDKYAEPAVKELHVVVQGHLGAGRADAVSWREHVLEPAEL
jgi:hypothetical protein